MAGVGAWALSLGPGFLAGALLLLAVVPFTLVVVAPTNRRLHELHAARQTGNAHALLTRWNRLHAARTGLGLAAFVVLLSTIGR